MGKGTIISGGDKGQYTIDIVYNSDAYDREITLLDQQIADLQIKYDNAPETTAEEKIAKSILKLQLTSLNKRQENLQSAYSGSTEKTVWCADLTEDLTGEVGTVEVPGESTNMQIQPGYDNNANYDSNRDGQLQLSYNMDYAGLFYNLAMLPGWQKWKPLFRYGTITAINNKLADITLEDIKSSQQAISINQTSTLTGVEFEYMTCDGAAFSEGDEVLIKFEGQDWTKPKIIGFRDNPKPCGGYLYVSNGTLCFVWDLETNTYATGVKDNNGDDAVFPIVSSEISDYLSNFSQVATPAVRVFEYSLPDIDVSYNAPYTVVSDWLWTGTCFISEKLWDIQRQQFIYTPDGEEYKEFTSQRQRQDYATIWGDGYAKVESWVGFNPIYHENGFTNYRITSNTNIKQIKGRNVTEEFSSFVHSIFKNINGCDQSMYGNEYAECSQIGGRGREESEIAQRTIQIKTYSPFLDKTIQTINLDNDLDISASASVTCEIDEWGTHYSKFSSSECHVNTKRKEVVDNGYNVGGVIGNESIPYTVVFYTEFVKTETVTNDVCGHLSAWRSCTDDNLLSYACNPDDTNEITTQVEVCEVKVFSAKDANGDPMNLNPFELPENNDLQTAMKELYDPEAMGYIPNISMSFLQ